MDKLAEMQMEYLEKYMDVNNSKERQLKYDIIFLRKTIKSLTK